MQAGAADAADVHAGAFPDRLEAFEDGDVFGGVIRTDSLCKDYTVSVLSQCRCRARCFERRLRRPFFAAASARLRLRSGALRLRARCASAFGDVAHRLRQRSTDLRIDDRRGSIDRRPRATTSTTRRGRLHALRIRCRPCPSPHPCGTDARGEPPLANTRSAPWRSRSRRSSPSFWHARIRSAIDPYRRSSKSGCAVRRNCLNWRGYIGQRGGVVASASTRRTSATPSPSDGIGD